MNLNFQGEKIELIPDTYNKLYNRRITYLRISKFHVKSKRAKLKFNYKDELFEVNYRKIDEKWIIQSF